jgi:hypothetical protein
VSQKQPSSSPRGARPEPPPPTHTRHEAHGSEHWHTPAPLVAACAYGLTPPPGAPGIDLDPFSCEEANETVGAARWIGPDEDGLRADWGQARRVFANPPFGSGIIELCLEAIAQHCVTARAVALVVTPPNVDAAWWHSHVCGVSGAALLLEGRVAFREPSRGAVAGNTKGTAIVAFGGTLQHRVEMLRRVRESIRGGSIATFEPPESARRRRHDVAQRLAARRGQLTIEGVA